MTSPSCFSRALSCVCFLDSRRPSAALFLQAITTNTVLASTMVSLCTFVVGYALQLLRDAFSLRLLLQFGSLALLLLCSAYEFLQSARLMTHAGFMFPVATGDSKQCASKQCLSPAAVEQVMAESENTQWAGLRFLYLAVNAAVWIIGGEWAFLCGCIATTRLFFARIDQPPPLLAVGVEASLYGSGLAELDE